MAPQELRRGGGATLCRASYVRAYGSHGSRTRRTAGSRASASSGGRTGSCLAIHPQTGGGAQQALACSLTHSAKRFATCGERHGAARAHLRRLLLLRRLAWRGGGGGVACGALRADGRPGRHVATTCRWCLNVKSVERLVCCWGLLCRAVRRACRERRSQVCHAGALPVSSQMIFMRALDKSLLLVVAKVSSLREQRCGFLHEQI